MNQNKSNNLPSLENDPLVSAEYRALSTEQTPTALDEVVLEQARAAAKNSWSQIFPSLWFRPIAFTATLGLTLMLLLELTTTPESQPIIDTDTNVGRLQPNVPISNEHTSPRFSQPRKNKKPRFEKVEAFSTSAITSYIAARSCTEEQMVDAPKWWQCITELKETGRNDEAKVELDFFKAVYPEFEPPD